LLAGRGFGKTRTGAEYVRAMVGMRRARRIALVAPTAADVRAVMVEGESGLLSLGPPDERPDYEPSKHLLT
jgi:phage terminase large subunit-like protein